MPTFAFLSEEDAKKWYEDAILNLIPSNKDKGEFKKNWIKKWWQASSLFAKIAMITVFAGVVFLGSVMIRSCSVTDVTVSPSTTSILRGRTQPFKAKIGRAHV